MIGRAYKTSVGAIVNDKYWYDWMLRLEFELGRVVAEVLDCSGVGCEADGMCGGGGGQGEEVGGGLHVDRAWRRRCADRG